MHGEMEKRRKGEKGICLCNRLYKWREGRNESLAIPSFWGVQKIKE